MRPNFICVLDGVGGWIDYLIDSGIMTKEFIGHIAHQIDNGFDETGVLSDILDHAQAKTVAKGATTATLAQLTQDCKLKTCNLGDSGYLILRPQDQAIVKVFKSQSQQYYFDCPYQTGNFTKDKPSSESFSTVHDCQLHDIIVMGTDGLWDNLFDGDIISMLESKIKNEKLNVT